jgi:hypothetical protein
MGIKTIASAGIALMIVAPAWAHHSFSMFDRQKVANATGTVKEYEWTNPHVWIHLMVADENGAEREWSFEMQAIAQDSAAGWRADSVKPGDKVSIEYHPLKDGSRGGQLMSATLANGQHLGPPAAARTVYPQAAGAAGAARPAN